jgi:hypothetical protein
MGELRTTKSPPRTTGSDPKADLVRFNAVASKDTNLQARYLPPK